MFRGVVSPDVLPLQQATTDPVGLLVLVGLDGGRSGGLKRLLPGTCPKDPPKLLLILFSLKNLRGLEPVGAVDL